MFSWYEKLAKSFFPSRISKFPRIFKVLEQISWIMSPRYKVEISNKKSFSDFQSQMFLKYRKFWSIFSIRKVQLTIYLPDTPA